MKCTGVERAIDSHEPETERNVMKERLVSGKGLCIEVMAVGRLDNGPALTHGVMVWKISTLCIIVHERAGGSNTRSKLC
jgi:hypothetical protein